MSIGNTNLHQRGEIPEIVKLPNGRIRVTRRFHKFTREDVDNANLGSLIGDFGDLDTTGEQIANQGYTDCRLISVEVDTRFNSVSNTDSAVLVKTYETLTSSFVQITDDTVTFTDNGLKQITRVYRAVSGTTSLNVVGVTTLPLTGEILASLRIEDNDAFAELTETYIEAGILSRTEDFVGSQDSLVIEAIGPDPITPSGFSLASKQESNYEGFQTNRFTFLKNDVQLSKTEDRVGSQLAISQQWFNPSADKTLAGYSLASKNISDFEGIETVEYRFLKDDVVLSESEDKVGSQLAVVQEVFNGTPVTPSGYSIANEQVSDFDGIPTRRYTFLKNNVELSRSEDLVGSQLAITKQVFNPTSDPVETGYSVARKEVSDVGGIPTKRFTFLKNNVILSVTEDKVGSQNAVVNEVFNPTNEIIAGIDTDGIALSGYSEANRTESDYEGIKTIRVQFLKNDVLLSKSEDEVGSQNAITEQWFKPIESRKTKANYSLARTEASDIDGILTERYTFLKSNVILSVSEDKVGSQNAVVNEVFNPTNEIIAGISTAGTALSGYSEANRTESDYEGIKTIRVQFLKNNVLLSQSEDEVGSQNAITEQWFNPTASRGTKTGYSLARTEKSDVNGILTERYTFLKSNVVLSVTRDKVGSQQSVINEVFNPTTYNFIGVDENGITLSEYSEASRQASDFEGIKTVRYTFLKKNVELSRSQDLVSSQLAITTQVFNPTAAPTETGYSLARTEESDVDGIPTKRYTFLKPSILSVQQDFNNGLKRVSVQAFNLGSAAVSTALNTIITSHKLIATNESDYAGIKTTTFQYQIDESFTEDYELNGLKRISLIELSASPFTAQVIGGLAGESATPPAEDPPNVVPAGSPIIGLYLGTQDIDNGGTIKVRKSVWIQAGTISVNTKNLSEGVTEVTTVSIGTEVTPIGPVLRKSVNNFNGLETYSVTELQNGNGQSIITGVANSYERLVPFSYPGVVSLTHERINGSSTNLADGYHVLAFHLNPPVQVKTEATVDVSFQTSGSIASSDFTHNTSVGYWNPLSWAETFQSGVAHGPNPFSDSQGLRGYRVDLDNGVENIGTFNGSSNNRTYITNGVLVMTRYSDSLDAYVGESWEYDNASFYYPRAEVLYTGQTSGAKAYLKQWGSASTGTLTLTRSGSGTNAIPFQANEVIRSAQAGGGNPFTLRRPIGGSVNIFGTSDVNGQKFSLNGKRLYATTAYFAKLSGGPENPSNKRWVLDVNIEPAFQDINGVNYYKKTIVTSDIL